MDKIALSIDEFAKATGIGRNKAHMLVRSKGFPAVRLGRRIVIPIEALNRWLEKQAIEGNQQDDLL